MQVPLDDIEFYLYINAGANMLQHRAVSAQRKAADEVVEEKTARKSSAQAQ